MRACIRVSVHTFEHDISATSWPIGMKFYLKHHWDRGKASMVLIQIGSELWFPWQQIAVVESGFQLQIDDVILNIQAP